jgi:hypothetical protein
MRIPFLILTVFSLYFVSSCRNDFEFEPSTEALRFSRDIVYLDTVFTNIGSSTYILKVYNPSDKNILLKSVKFGKGLNSKFRMTVDGMSGDNRIFDNVEMLAKDSMFIFIEVTADVLDANPGDFLYEDEIEFHHFGGLPTQTVDVVTLIQDAIFIKPNRTFDSATSQYIYELLNLSGSPTQIRGYELTDAELNWTSAKPYVVYDWVKIPNNKTLNIGPGTRVHFHKNSGMIVDSLATLNIDGAVSTYNTDGQIVTNNYVQFLGDRLEQTYYNVPGQWGGILNFSNQNNTINYLKLKNAGIGLYMRPLNLNNPYKTKLTITNSEIYNCSQSGLFALRGDITGRNLVIDNCGLYSFAGIIGGKYNFTHCTFHNRWNSPNQLSVYLSNGLKTNSRLFLSDLEEANFNNSMIYGNNRIQFVAKDESVAGGSALLNFKFNHCLIKFDATNSNLINNPLFNFTDTARYINCSIANNSTVFKPKFKLTRYHPYDLTEAYTIPNNNSFSTFSDILNRPRTGQINVGAYQFTN